MEKKLGIKANMIVRVIMPPNGHLDYFTSWHEGIIFSENDQGYKDLIHYFAKDLIELQKCLPLLKLEIRQSGCIWVSWPKKARKVPTDVSEDNIWECALTTGMVDVKVCAVDDTWSALKLVIPVKDRK